MHQKIIKPIHKGTVYLFVHPVRRAFSIVSILLLSFITYCSVCMPSDLDTSQEGWTGVMVTALLQPLQFQDLPSAIAVGTGGNISYTYDGQNWNSKTIAPAGVSFNSAIFTGLNFVAAGGQGTSCSIYFSSNGVDWKPSSLPGVCSDSINAMAYGGGRIIAVAGFNTYASASLILTSSDHGISWTAASGPVIEFTHIAFDGSYFLAAGNTSFLPDVYRRTPVGSFAAAPFRYPFSNIKNCSLGRLFKIPGSTRTVAAGNTCANLSAPSTSTYTDNSASSAWVINQNDVFGGNTSLQIPRGLAYGKNRLVAVGDSCRVDVSTDPLQNLAWNFNASMSGCTAGTVWKDIVFDGSKFIAVGEYGGAFPVGVIAVSGTGNPADWSISNAGGFRPISIVSVN